MKLQRTLCGLLTACMMAAFCSGNAQQLFKPGEVWNDVDGVPVNAHGGGVLFDKGKYYWFGESRARFGTEGVGVYSSTDLHNWRREGLAFIPDSDTTSEVGRGCVIERPKVLYNKKTGKYVMWFHLELRGKGYSAARAAVAVSNNVTGPYTYIGSFRPNGNMSRDMTLYQDNDSTAYQIYSSDENYTLRIVKLAPDYLSATAEDYFMFRNHREAPAVFKYDKKYYLITSGCTGWAPNQAALHVADSLTGPWKELGDPMRGADALHTYGAQSTFVLPVQGKKDAFIFMADQWNPKNLVNSRYVWLPIQFNKGVPFVEWSANWSLEGFDRR